MHQIVQINAVPGAQKVDILASFRGLLPNKGCRIERVSIQTFRFKPCELSQVAKALVMSKIAHCAAPT